MSLQKLLDHLDKHKDPERDENLARFFKTGKGEYGEGDKFLGLKVPALRQAVRIYWRDLSLADVDHLVQRKYHEHRLTGLLILVKKYEKGSDEDKKSIYDFYLSHLDRINNWDLVDLSSPNIVGDYLLTHPRKVLYKLAGSSNLWHRRVAVLATSTFIRHGEFTDTLALATILLHDSHDLIHKAVGWMLREVGKRDLPTLLSFLDTHTTKMPRTMLRYAIEKLTPATRKHYLSLK